MDWAYVLDAVQYAISLCPVGLEALQQDSVDVELPMPLTDLEYVQVSRWVGAESPVIYRYQDDIVQDGRHRLWLTRQHANGRPVPVVASALIDLGDARAGETKALTTPALLETVRAWWEQTADAKVRSANDAHLRHVALIYLELTSPEPLPAQWFTYLQPWDRALPSLAQLHADHRTSPELLAKFLHEAWRWRQDSQGLDLQLALSMFLELFDRHGFTMEGQPAPKPRGALTLYRGATSENRCGISWTLKPSIADYFAAYRQAPGAIGRVWTAHIPAARLLAFFPDENEFIADLRGMEDLVRPAPDTAGPHLLARWSTWRLRRLYQRRVGR